MNNKKQLIKLQDKFILVSDEEIKEGDFIVSKNSIAPLYIDGKINTVEMLLKNHWFKIIAGIPELPPIDFSLLKEEDCKTIGWYDVEKLAKDYAKIHPTKDIDEEERYYNSNCKYYDAYIEGFKTAQSLNDKKFSLEQVMKIAEFGFNQGYSERQYQLGEITRDEYCKNGTSGDFIQSLQQTSWDVEAEGHKIIKILNK